MLQLRCDDGGVGEVAHALPGIYRHALVAVWVVLYQLVAVAKAFHQRFPVEAVTAGTQCPGWVMRPAGQLLGSQYDACYFVVQIIEHRGVTRGERWFATG